MATITYDQQEQLAHFARRRKMRYPVLADPRSEAIRAFGLLNENYPPDSYAHGVAHPITIVFDADGVVTHRFSRAGYVRRPDIDVVLAVLRGKRTAEGGEAEPRKQTSFLRRLFN